MAAAIQSSWLFQNARRDLSAERHRAGSAFFESGFVQKCVGICVDQLVRKLRRDRSIDCEALDASILNPTQHAQQTIKIHRFLQDVLHHFPHQGMIRNLDVALDVFKARRRLREDAGQEIFRTRALHLRSDALAFRVPQQLEASPGRPAPSRLEYRGGERGLFQQATLL